jgi:transposase-like protein
MTNHLSRMLKDVSHLSAQDLVEFDKVYKQQAQRIQSSLVLREAEDAIRSCPHCQCPKVVGAGSSKDGRKRFKCKECSKTFNAYTGTPLARLHMPEKHIENAQCMIEGLSVREVARKIGVNPKTAFLWRHRLLITSMHDQPAALSGVVEADETFFLECFKGQRKGLPRPAKIRGTKASKPGLSKEQIPVIVARDRSTGATLTAKIS